MCVLCVYCICVLCVYYYVGSCAYASVCFVCVCLCNCVQSCVLCVLVFVYLVCVCVCVCVCVFVFSTAKQLRVKWRKWKSIHFAELYLYVLLLSTPRRRWSLSIIVALYCVSLLPSVGAGIPHVKDVLSQFVPHHLFSQFCWYPCASPTVYPPYNLTLKSEFLSQAILRNPRTDIKVAFPFSDTWKYFWFKIQKFTATQVQINFVPRCTYAGTGVGWR